MILILDIYLIASVSYGQDAFVLCRLFRKPEEKPDASKYDEVDQTGLSPTTTKSSPDDTSSDLLQETATSGMPVGEEPEVVNKWLTNKSDKMALNARVPVDGGSNSNMASDVEDHIPDGTALEVRWVSVLAVVIFTCI